ncbi:MAG: DUF58 domain-containing protein [Anaerolineae bacterium]
MMDDRRRNAVYLIIAVSLLAGLITGQAFFFNVGYAFIGLMVFALAWAWGSANWLSIRRRAQARRAQVGSTLKETFIVTNTGPQPKLWLEIYDSSSLPGHHASHVISSLPPKESAVREIETLCSRRGEFVLGPMKVATGDPFGLFQLERDLPQTSRLIVYPQTIDVGGFQLPAGPLPGGDALRQRTHYVTTNAAGIRDYMPGDSLNRIHWRSTARKQRLLVKEFELDPLSDLWIMLDAEKSVHTGESAAEAPTTPPYLPPTTEEYAITAAASLARLFLMKDRAVGFVAHAQRREYLQVDRGGRQLNKILETLAVLRAEGTLPFDHLLRGEADILSRGTTVIMITPSTRNGWVDVAQEFAARGLQMVAVVVDAETFGGRPGARRIAMQSAGANIPTYMIQHGDDLSNALSG